MISQYVKNLKYKNSHLVDHTGYPWVLEFKSYKFRDLKVLENSWNMICWFWKILIV